jgi:hypothetical protein
MGLPAFHEYDPSKPLTAKYDEDDESYSDNQPSRRPSNFSNLQTTGYAAATDAYHATPGTTSLGTAAATAATTYPPQPQVGPPPSTQYSTYGNVANPSVHEQYPSINAYGDSQHPSNPQYNSAYGYDQYPSNNQSYYASAEGTYAQGQSLSADQGGTPYGHQPQTTSCKFLSCSVQSTRLCIILDILQHLTIPSRLTPAHIQLVVMLHRIRLFIIPPDDTLRLFRAICY